MNRVAEYFKSLDEHDLHIAVGLSLLAFGLAVTFTIGIAAIAAGVILLAYGVSADVLTRQRQRGR